MAELPKGWEMAPPQKPTLPEGWTIGGKYKTEADDLGDTAAITAGGLAEGARAGANPLSILEGVMRLGTAALPYAHPGAEALKISGADELISGVADWLSRNKKHTDPLMGWASPTVAPLAESFKNVTGMDPRTDLSSAGAAYTATGAEKTPLREALAAGARTLGGAIPTLAIPGMATASGLKSIAASTVGAGVGRAIGGDSGELIGAIAAPFAGPALAGATRGVVRGTRAPVMQEALDDARIAGTPISLGQATQSTALNRLESTVGRIGGPGVMRGFSEKQTAQMSERVEDIAGRFSPKMEDVTAGKKVLEGLTGPGGFVDRSGTKAQKLYAAVDKAVPENTPITMANTLAYMTERTKINPLAPETTAAFNQEVIGRLGPKMEAMLSDMRKNRGALPYSAVKDIRTSVGKQIDEAALTADFTQKEARALYAAISRDIESALTGPALKSWQRANNFYSARMSHIDDVIAPIAGKNTPEQVISALETNAKQGSTMIRGVMSSLKPDDRSVVSAMFIRKMGEATPGNQSAAGTQFSIPQFLTRWNRLDEGAKRVMFDSAGGRDLRAALDSLAKTSERIKRGSQVLSNNSGTTNAAIMGAGLGGATVAAMTGNFKLAGAIGGTMVLGNITARMMTSPKVVRWLAQSTGLDPRAALTSLDQLILKTQDPALKADLEAFKTEAAGRR